MRRLLNKDGDLLGILVVTLLAVYSSQHTSGPVTVVRILTAVPFVFICPGYALLQAIFRRPFEGGLMSLMLVVGISISLAVLGGILLNLTPWGLQSVSWILLISMFTVGCVLLGLIRRVQKQPVEMSVQDRSPFRLPHPVSVLFAAVSIVFAIGALWIARDGAFAQHSAYTRLWINGDNNAFQVSIQSHETTEVDFNVEVKIGNTVIQEWPDVQMLPGVTWNSQMTLSKKLRDIAASMDHPYISAALYRLEAPDILYRYVTLHLEAENQP